MPRLQRLLRNFGSIAVVVVLLAAVTFLPPDTSLSEVRSTATLKACVPASYPPLVTGDAERPGIDVELLQEVARRIGVALVLNVNRGMGRDFNPRNWGLNRAQCQMIAGGMVDSEQTRSFLSTGPSYADTGWAIVSVAPVASLKGLTLGVLTLASGLDRIGLGTFLRAEGATARVVTTPEALAAGIADGSFDAGVTEALLASKIASDNKWQVAWAPPPLARYRLAFGLWKGDITLKRAIDQAFADFTADGTLKAILDRYGVTPID